MRHLLFITFILMSCILNAQTIINTINETDPIYSKDSSKIAHLTDITLDGADEIATANQIHDSLSELNNVIRTGELDLKYVNDSSKLIHWGDTINKVATKDDVNKIDSINGNLDINGDLTYNFIHAVGSADAISYSPVITQNAYTKLVPNITWREQDGITCVDSIRILTSGDYRIDISIALSGTNANDFWRLKIYKNGAAFSPELGRFRWRNTSSGVTDTRSYFWYLKDLAANNWISFRLTNETASRNPTITDFKVYIEKKPE